MSKKDKPALNNKERDRVILYLCYALEDVENLSVQGARYLKAAIDELEQKETEMDEPSAKVALN